MIPRVAIVGRPNVGKSSLFNWLAGKRIAIVDPTAGVTRDRVGSLITTAERPFELFDTGGIGIKDVDDLDAEVGRQIQTALTQSHLILFVVDARDGIVPLDEHVAQRLRGLNKPVVLVVNKCDTDELDDHATDFYRFGLDPLIAVSAHQNRGREELLGAVVTRLPADPEPLKPKETVLKLAIVGRRNTGKSTFINCLAQEERTIVSEVPGTTRDSIDVLFEQDGQTILAIDTAGVRRKSSIANSIEFYSMARAERSIRRADVVLLFFDPRWTISKVDKQLAGYILNEHKPAIFVVNKWDLAVENFATGTYGEYIRKIFPSLDFVPIAFITAKDGKNVKLVCDLAKNLLKQASARVETADLNKVLRRALELNPPPMRQNRRPKINFATQVAVEPPTIVLFTNGPELFDVTYQRYLLKTFRDQLPFHDVPVKMYLRHKHRDERRGDADIDTDLDSELSGVREPDETSAPGTGRRGRRPANVRPASAPPGPATAAARKPRGPKPPKNQEPAVWKDV